MNTPKQTTLHDQLGRWEQYHRETVENPDTSDEVAVRYSEDMKREFPRRFTTTTTNIDTSPRDDKGRYKSKTEPVTWQDADFENGKNLLDADE
jgi:hypothetical protein